MTDDIIRKATTADYIETIDNLRAEVERLRSECRELKKTDVWANDVVKEHESLRGQIAAKEARIKELEALNESLIENGNDLRARCWKAEARIKDLEALDEFKDAYIKRLEAAFLRSNAAMRYYQEGNRGPWPQLGEKFKEPYQEKAREALERIKEGGKDE